MEKNLSPGKLLLITEAACIDNILPFCCSLSLRKTTYLCLQFATFLFHFQNSVKLSSEWKGKIQALVKSWGLFEDDVPIFVEEKMFNFCFFFTYLSTIQVSVNSTFSNMILKLLKSLAFSCSIYALLLHFQRWCEIWSLLTDMMENTSFDNL